jgi:hypothetical protein
VPELSGTLAQTIAPFRRRARGFSVLQDYLDLHGGRALSWEIPNDGQIVDVIVQLYATEIEGSPARHV